MSDRSRLPFLSTDIAPFPLPLSVQRAAIPSPPLDRGTSALFEINVVNTRTDALEFSRVFFFPTVGFTSPRFHSGGRQQAFPGSIKTPPPKYVLNTVLHTLPPSSLLFFSLDVRCSTGVAALHFFLRLA